MKEREYIARAVRAERLKETLPKLSGEAGRAYLRVHYLESMQRQLSRAVARLAGLPFPLPPILEEDLSPEERGKQFRQWQIEGTVREGNEREQEMQAWETRMDEILPLSKEWTKAGWEYVEHAPCPDGKMRGKYLAELVPVLRMRLSHEAWVGVLHGTDTLGEWVPWTEADSVREQEKYAAERPIDFSLGITWAEAQERIWDLCGKAAKKYNAASDVHMAADSAWHGLNRELFATDIVGPDEPPSEVGTGPNARAEWNPVLEKARANSKWGPLVQFLAKAMQEGPGASRAELAVQFGIVCDRYPKAKAYCERKGLDPAAVNLDTLGRLRKMAARFPEQMQANRLKSDG